jgi:hypothetical protein
LLLPVLAKALLPEGGELPLADLYADAFPNLIGLGVCCGLILIMIIFLRPGRRPSPLLGGLLVALIAADLLLFGFRFIRFTPNRQVFPATGVTGFLQKNLAGGRLLALSPVPLERAWPASDLPQASYMLRGLRPLPQALLPPNTPMVYRLRDLLGYDSLYLADYRALLGELEGRDPSPPANGNLLLAYQARQDLLPRLGVRYLLSRNSLEGKGLRLVYDRECKIYALSGAPSRAGLSAGAEPGAAVTGKAEIISDEVNHVALTAAGPVGFLVLADTRYPGWRAYLDGRETPILPARGVFRAVAFPAGRHRVDFYYRPQAFKIGLFALLLAVAAAGLGIGVKGWRHAQEK